MFLSILINFISPKFSSASTLTFCSSTLTGNALLSCYLCVLIYCVSRFICIRGIINLYFWSSWHFTFLLFFYFISLFFTFFSFMFSLQVLTIFSCIFFLYSVFYLFMLVSDELFSFILSALLSIIRRLCLIFSVTRLSSKDFP